MHIIHDIKSRHMRDYIESIADYISSTELFYKLPLIVDLKIIDLEIVNHWIEWLYKLTKEHEFTPLLWDRNYPPSIIATANALLVLTKGRKCELDYIVNALNNRRSKIGFWSEIHSTIPILKKILPFEWNYTRLSVYTSLRVLKAMSTYGYEDIVLDFIRRLENIQGRSGLWITDGRGDIELTAFILLYCNEYLSEISKERAINALRSWLEEQLYLAINVNILKKTLVSLALIASGYVEVEFRNLLEYVKTLLSVQTPSGSLDYTPNRSNRKWITIEIMEHASKHIPEVRRRLKRYIHRNIIKMDSVHKVLENIEKSATEYFRELLEENILRGIKTNSMKIYLLLLSSIFEQFHWVENRDAIEYLSKFKSIIHEEKLQRLDNEKRVYRALRKSLPNRIGNNTVHKLATTVSALYRFFSNYSMNNLKEFYGDLFKYTIKTVSTVLDPDTDLDKVSNLANALRIGASEGPSIRLLCTTLRSYPCIGVNTIASFIYYITKVFNIVDIDDVLSIEIPLDYRLIDILSRTGVMKRGRNISTREDLNRIAFELSPEDKLKILALRYLWMNYCTKGRYLHIPAAKCPLKGICSCRLLPRF